MVEVSPFASSGRLRVRRRMARQGNDYGMRQSWKAFTKLSADRMPTHGGKAYIAYDNIGWLGAGKPKAVLT